MIHQVNLVIRKQGIICSDWILDGLLLLFKKLPQYRLREMYLLGTGWVNIFNKILKLTYNDICYLY